jgi:hypothetical protein
VDRVANGAVDWVLPFHRRSSSGTGIGARFRTFMARAGGRGFNISALLNLFGIGAEYRTSLSWTDLAPFSRRAGLKTLGGQDPHILALLNSSGIDIM